MTLTSHGLANRPGEPYPATFQKKHEQLKKVGHSCPTFFADRWAWSAHPPFSKVDRRGIEPRFPACKAGVVPLDQQPVLIFEYAQVIEVGVEPTNSPRSQRDRFTGLRTRSISSGSRGRTWRVKLMRLD